MQVLLKGWLIIPSSYNNNDNKNNNNYDVRIITIKKIIIQITMITIIKKQQQHNTNDDGTVAGRKVQYYRTSTMARHQQCLLAPRLDIIRLQERGKAHNDTGVWRCLGADLSMSLTHLYAATTTQPTQGNTTEPRHPLFLYFILKIHAFLGRLCGDSSLSTQTYVDKYNKNDDDDRDAQTHTDGRLALMNLG